jgi:hypothetical protein
MNLRLSLGLLALITCTSVRAEVPLLIHYQGRLLQGTNLVNASLPLNLRLYTNASSGPFVYEDTGTVSVVDGLYATYIGDGTSYGTLAEAVTNGDLYVEVVVNGNVLTPRERMTAVAFALVARSVADGGVSSSAIADGAVSSSKLATGAVGAVHLAAGAVTAGSVASNAVTTDAITDGTILAEDLADLAAWKVTGNAGTATGMHFIGTTDAQPLEFRVNDSRVLQITADASPSFVAGHSANLTTNNPLGAVIAGGGSASARNMVLDDYGVIGGGMGNTVGGQFAASTDAVGSVVGGGVGNYNNAIYSTIAGGQSNRIDLFNFFAPGGWSVIGGGFGNIIYFVGTYATIAGGVSNVVTDDGAAIGGGMMNTAAAYSVIGGGAYNAALVQHATVGGGLSNIASAGFSTIGGGRGNRTSAQGATVGGGLTNTAGGEYSTVGGGLSNRASTFAATVGGGEYNRVLISSAATIAGGHGNVVSNTSQGASILGGYDNSVGEQSIYGVIGGGSDNIIANRAGSGVTIAGGMDNYAAPTSTVSTIGGGQNNQVGPSTVGATVSGGFNNAGSNGYTHVGGGRYNVAGGFASAVGGGETNRAMAEGSVIAGGQNNLVATGATYASIGGGINHLINTAASYAVIAGGFSNIVQANAQESVIGGGYENRIAQNADGGTIAGGVQNVISNNGDYGTIGGGQGNVIKSVGGFTHYGLTIAGGRNNSLSGEDSTIGGGQLNQLGDVLYGTIGGGYSNRIANLADYSVIGGGYTNYVGDAYATVPGGAGNQAVGAYSFAAGKYARALNLGSFVWSDPSGGTNAVSVSNNSWTVRCVGGARFLTHANMATVGVQLVAGANQWSSMSDRNVKENFEAVDPRTVLERVAQMPVTTWNLKSQDPSVRHIGPMAQDFHAAFGVGESDRYIGVSDADGVALAAIQGLYQMLQEKQREIDDLKRQVEALKAGPSP